MKKRYSVLIISIYSIIIILLVVAVVLFVNRVSGGSNSELLDALKDLSHFWTQDTATPETLESATTSYYEYMSEHWDEYLAEEARLEATYLDKNMQHIPRDSDFELIEEGMHISQVVEIVGKPHDFHGVSNFSYAMVWESVQGEILTVCVTAPGGGPLDIGTVMEGNYTVGEPMRESES